MPSLTVQIQNASYVKVLRGDTDKLDKCLSREIPGSYHSEAYQNNRWDGHRHFYQAGRRRFPLGLLPRVIREYKGLVFIKHSKEYLTFCHQKKLKPLKDIRRLIKARTEDGASLRDYQEEAYFTLGENTLKTSINPDELLWQRGIVNHVTASGKSFLIGSVALGARGGVLIIVHTRDLLYQHKAFLEAFTGEKIGIMGDSMFNLERVTVCTVQTLHRRIMEERQSQGRTLLSKIGSREIDAIVVDEAHLITGITTQFYKSVMALNAPIRLGFTGTAERKSDVENMTVEACLGRILHTVKHDQLERRGLVSPIKIEMHPVQYDYAEFLKTWPQVRSYAVVHNPVKNKIILDICKEAKSDTTLIVTRIVEHAKEIYKALKHHKLKVKCVTGGDSTEKRRKAIKDLSEGKIDILVTTTIFDEGINIPSISLLILAIEEKSETKLLQRLGRGSRKAENKDSLRVVDFWNTSHMTTLEHSQKRLYSYEKEGFEVTMK